MALGVTTLCRLKSTQGACACVRVPRGLGSAVALAAAASLMEAMAEEEEEEVPINQEDCWEVTTRRDPNRARDRTG